MSKQIKEYSSQDNEIYFSSFKPKVNIAQKLYILPCIPNSDLAHRLFRKRRYFTRRLDFFSENTSSKFNHCKHTRRKYVSCLDIDSKTYLKNLQLTKKLRSLQQFRCTVYTKDPSKTVKRVWKTLCSRSIHALKVEYPYLADTSILFKILASHRNLEVLFYERLYSNFMIRKQSHANMKRHRKLWESLKVLKIYKSLFDQGEMENLIFKSKILQTLEIESNNEIEDESLSKLIPKLTSLHSLKALFLKFSECYTQQFLFNLLVNLQHLQNLQELTLFTPLCIPSPLTVLNDNHIQLTNLRVLNLAISQTQRGHGHSEAGEASNFYEFFSRLRLPNLQHLAVVLENSPHINSDQVSRELQYFLRFLTGLSPTLEYLVIQCYGASLEYFEWEHILATIGTLENLKGLELSEISYFNNFCLGLISQTISKLKKLQRLYLKPVTVVKKKFLNLFIDSVLSHETLDSLYLTVNKFSINHTQSLLNKLREFWLKTKFDGLKEHYHREFSLKNKSSILGCLFYRFSGW